MAHERILITVKTYPTLSRKYGELVCTAGLREDGSWVRLFPVPFRLLDYHERYAKFDWVETVLVKSSSDPRPETFHPFDPRDLKKIGHMDTAENWRERRQLILGRAKIHTDLQSLITAAHDNRFSLAVFKPSRVLDFTWEPDERDWDQTKVDEMRARADQGELFAGEDWRRTFEVIPKLPFKFSNRFADATGKESELQVLDWEAGQLFWNCLASSGDEQAALQKVRAKYFGEFLQKDLHFFLGTTKEYHGWATNPWVIIGVFPIPHERQAELF
ncbi:MAG: hypothetical protein KGJ37_02695 [Verrucomicrobiota bacterium]|nr:hypothetical protein [Verrucomicrobiota bacterium]